jgi:hypothetical protein
VTRDGGKPGGTRARLRRTAWLMVLPLAACAHVDHFRAEPRNACAGDQVQVRWDARGSVELESKPPLPGTGAQPSRGEASFRVDEGTRFFLRAHRLLRDAQAEADVEVAPAEQAFGEVARCTQAGGLRAELALTTQLSEGFRVGSVRNVLERTVEVEKGGRRLSLSPGEKSPALQGEPVLGTWLLRSPLAPGEDCDAALRSVRQRLQVAIGLDCGG